MDIIVTLLINGFAEGALIFLMASGLSIILGLMGVVNFTHGTLFLWGGYVFIWIYHMTGSFILGILAAIVVVFLLGIFFEKLFVSRVYGNVPAQILITLGLQVIFTDLVRLFWGATPIAVLRPDFLSGTTIIGGVTIVHYRIFLIAVGLVVALGIHFLLNRTKVGMVIRAGVQRPDMVQALGKNIRLYFTLVFAGGAALAGLGGALYAPLVGNMVSTAGVYNQILAFIVVVVGGMGSFIGSAMGSIFLGLMGAIIGWYAPSLAVVANVTLMALVLAFKPQGLFGLAVKK
ncbi:amino acid/amide ABC transporter membrane protein 1, HAAT family (TC 3.A.1.4.-) [Proteiniborus ethanoligenes]|uniref:Amino acid/amide ABC transporter membrane protein 1, HAAT family (TC 3.A.1.4.-) n=1 Tax=Proteiniborus ethanoligenes TaxID=415015 RepID=A0A1H3NSM3_9FIRM|nr:branched-chain amino acid ABC transporter permease [Proteiniborus ethanoligenes]SDY91921.1 amino acid/amide ABC transporter membrane protein 1, HAAT family (TC 3.A.1.4.-) [Proteiniborus ethanoligenes]